MCTSIKLINFINIIRDTIIMLDKASININIILQILDFARNFTFLVSLFFNLFSSSYFYINLEIFLYKKFDLYIYNKIIILCI